MISSSRVRPKVYINPGLKPFNTLWNSEHDVWKIVSSKKFSDLMVKSRHSSTNIIFFKV